MDPEIYVFPKISSAPVKIASSTALFILVFFVTGVLLPLLPGPRGWTVIDQSLTAGTGLKISSPLWGIGSAGELVAMHNVIFAENSLFLRRLTDLLHHLEDCCDCRLGLFNHDAMTALLGIELLAVR
jgi:ABC-type amino acid transport system permease subunit